MAKPEVVSWNSFQLAVTLLLAVISLLFSGLSYFIINDLTEIKKNAKDSSVTLQDVRVQTAVTNQKLDDLIGEFRRQRPR